MTYCKLYIDDEMAIEELQRLADKGVEFFFNSTSADAVVFANENYLTKKGGDYSTDPVYRSKYYVEIENEPGEDFERESFVAGTAGLVQWLRGYCEYVVASCDFEEDIVEKTGWNWTLETPMSPPYKRIRC